MHVLIDMDHAKEIGHTHRRKMRAKEFAPHDEVIMKQIPGNDYTQAEAARQAIREKYAVMQEQIDAAEHTDAIREALGLPPALGAG